MHRIGNRSPLPYRRAGDWCAHPASCSGRRTLLRRARSPSFFGDDTDNGTIRLRHELRSDTIHVVERGGVVDARAFAITIELSSRTMEMPLLRRTRRQALRTKFIFLLERIVVRLRRRAVIRFAGRVRLNKG